MDEAASLLQSDPLRWLALTWGPAAPLAALSLLFIHAHRAWWIGESWEAVLPRSVAASAALLAAYLIRGVGHGRAAREVVRTLHPAAVREPGDRAGGRVLDLVAAASLGGGVTLLLSLLSLPGLLAAGFFAGVPALIAVEGRDLPAALGAATRLPRGTTGKGALVALFMVTLALLAWANLLLLGVGGVWLLRALTGADVGLLAQLLSPTNGGFLAGAAVLALLVVEPVWVIARTLVYLDGHLGRSGADLLERWEALGEPGDRNGGGATPPSAPWWSAAGVLLLSLAVGAAPAAAQDGDGAAEVPSLESARVSTRTLVAYASDVDEARSLLDGRIKDYETSAWEDLTELRVELAVALRGPVFLTDGRLLQLDPEPLLAALPDWIHTEETLRDARRAALRMAEAAEEARALASPPGGAEGPDPRALLDDELALRDYGEQSTRGGGDAYRESLRERISGFFRRIGEWLDSSDTGARQSRPPAIDIPGLRWVVIGAALLLLIVLLGLFARQYIALGAGGRPAEEIPPGGRGALPDARTKSPTGWRDEAERLAEAGRRREAARALYLAVLSALDRSREIDYRPQKTNGALVAGFRGQAERASRFEAATWGYETAWYGHVAPDEAEYLRLRSVCDHLVRPTEAVRGPS